MDLDINRVGMVIPAYNEEHNLPAVLDAVCATDWLAQIVVVDDGSTDGTWAVAQRYAVQDERLKVLRLPQNLGKADALQTGVRAIQADFVIFVDADLVGLRSDHLRQICAPLLKGATDMAIALFYRGNVRVDVSHQLTPALSGQRCLGRWAAEQALASLTGTGYGVEVGLALFARRYGWRVQYLFWERISHVPKEQKRGWLAGMGSRLRMNWQVLTTWLGSNKRFELASAGE